MEKPLYVCVYMLDCTASMAPHFDAMYKALQKTLEHLALDEYDVIVSGFGMRDFRNSVSKREAWHMLENSWSAGNENTSRLFTKLSHFTDEDYWRNKNLGNRVQEGTGYGATMPIQEQIRRYTQWLDFEDPQEFLRKMLKPTAAGGWDAPESYASSLYIARLMFQKARNDNPDRKIIPFIIMLVDDVPHAFASAWVHDNYPKGDPTGIQFSMEVAELKRLGVSCNIFMPGSSMERGLAGQCKNVCVWDHMATQLGGCLQELHGAGSDDCALVMDAVDRFMRREKSIWDAQHGATSWDDCADLMSLDCEMPDLVAIGDFPEIDTAGAGGGDFDQLLYSAIHKHARPATIDIGWQARPERAYSSRPFDSKLRVERSASAAL